MFKEYLSSKISKTKIWKIGEKNIEANKKLQLKCFLSLLKIEK